MREDNLRVLASVHVFPFVRWEGQCRVCEGYGSW